jgi:hypothetical protein
VEGWRDAHVAADRAEVEKDFAELGVLENEADDGAQVLGGRRRVFLGVWLIGEGPKVLRRRTGLQRET